MNDALVPSLILGAVLFVTGAAGFLIRRNMIIMFLSTELMLQGVVLNLVAFSDFHRNMGGVALAVFVLTVAACEAAIALALVAALYQQHKTLDVAVATELRELVDEVPDEQPEIETPEAEAVYPTLSPAGREPVVTEEELHLRV
ncbi:MAG: NADH-quinone oxidoreductase subunit NuoK [Planctomycetia bacterium]